MLKAIENNDNNNNSVINFKTVHKSSYITQQYCNLRLLLLYIQHNAAMDYLFSYYRFGALVRGPLKATVRTREVLCERPL